MIELVASVTFVALALLIVWRCNQPDPDVLKGTRERRQMRNREECSSRFGE